MKTICPKCQYERQPGDNAPPEECPSCGVIYSKVVQGAPKNPVRTSPNPAEIKRAPSIPIAATEQGENSPSERAPQSNPLLIECEACDRLHSIHAVRCPACHHPNVFAPRTAGLIAGVIAISLGIDAALMPYFAAVFLVPSTYAAAAVTAILRMRTLAGIAAILASVGLYNIYQTSKAIHEAGMEAQNQLEKSR